MGQAASQSKIGVSVVSYMQPVIEEFAHVREDLDSAHGLVFEQQDAIDKQARTIRALETKIATLQFALSVAIAENESILQEARSMKTQLHEKTNALDLCTRELSDARNTLEAVRTRAK